MGDEKAPALKIPSDPPDGTEPGWWHEPKPPFTVGSTRDPLDVPPLAHLGLMPSNLACARAYVTLLTPAERAALFAEFAERP